MPKKYLSISKAEKKEGTVALAAMLKLA